MATNGISSFNNGRKRKPGDPVDDPRQGLNFPTYGPDGMAGPSPQEAERRRKEAIFNASAPRTAASIADFNKSTASAADSFDQGNVARGIGQVARATAAGIATPFAAVRDSGSATLENLNTSRRAISDFAGDVYNTTKGTASTAASQLAEGFSGVGPSLRSASAAPSQAEIDAYAKSKGLMSKPPDSASPARPAAPSAPAISSASSPSIGSASAAGASIPNAPQPYAAFTRPASEGSRSVTPEQAAQMARSAPTIETPTIGTPPEQRPTVRGIASFVEPPAGAASAPAARAGRSQQEINMITNGTPGGIGTFSVIGGNEPSAAPRLPQFKELNSRTMSIGEYADAKAYNRNLATSLGLQNQAAQTANQGRAADARTRIDMFEAELRAQGMPSQIAEREAQAQAARATASRAAAEAPLAQRRSQLELAVLNGDASAKETLKSLAEANVGSKDFDLSRQMAFQKAYQDDVKRYTDSGRQPRSEQMYINSLSDSGRAAYGKSKVDFPKPAANIVKELQDRYAAADDAKNSALKTELLRRWSETFGEDATKYLSK
ncbi:hypothetical protein [Massilia sp. NP310]|uniref:hypothetical protein n=1 Tax=Massilia sp. NP310 TaxID=2861282 RepID=UPI001C62DAC7|nr:hypothetical protein [Massilia sp. NP310]QYG04006.1 hypothetical protein KY496_11810 [Massilia sp. NP310]